MPYPRALSPVRAEPALECGGVVLQEIMRKRGANPRRLMDAGDLSGGEVALCKGVSRHLSHISLAAASKHMPVLELDGLLYGTVSGRVRMCQLQAGPPASSYEWLRFYEDFCSGRLAACESLFQPDSIPSDMEP